MIKFYELIQGEMLRRMREIKEREVMNKQQTEIDALGDYNAFSRPRPVSIIYVNSDNIIILKFNNLLKLSPRQFH